MIDLTFVAKDCGNSRKTKSDKDIKLNKYLFKQNKRTDHNENQICSFKFVLFDYSFYV